MVAFRGLHEPAWRQPFVGMIAVDSLSPMNLRRSRLRYTFAWRELGRRIFPLLCLMAPAIGLASQDSVLPPSTNDAVAIQDEATSLESLVEGFKGELDQRKATRDRLVEIGARATPVLLPLLEHEDGNYRWEIVNVLGYIADRAAIPGLARRIVVDTNVHVRWRALWALSVTDRTGAEARRIFREHTQDEDPFHRWNANIGLSMFDEPSCLPAIHEGLVSEDDWVRWEAVNALRRVNSAESSSLMEPLLLNDPDQRVRQECAFALGLICDATALRLLRVALDAETPTIRWRAALSIARCADAGSLDALEARLAKEEDERTREQLEKTLQKIRGLPARPSAPRTVSEGGRK